MQNTKGQKSTKVLFLADREFPMDLADYPMNAVFTVVRSLDELGCAIRHEDTKYDIFSISLDSGLDTLLWVQRYYPDTALTKAKLVIRASELTAKMKELWGSMK